MSDAMSAVPPTEPPPGPPKKRGLRKGAYLLPSLFTVGNIALGFYAVVLALEGEYRPAVLLIFLAAVLDGLDGRIARVTQTESDFGREYDSLADVITFGVGPALLAYLWGLDHLDRIGWFAPLFFIVCAATRLARFNINTRVVDKRFFVGLPAPAGAGTVGSVLYFLSFGEPGPLTRGILLTVLAIVSLLMVSNFRYYSFKELDPRRRWSFRIVVPIALVILVLAFSPAGVFLTVSGSYALSGPTLWLRGLLRRSGSAGEAPKQAGDET